MKIAATKVDNNPVCLVNKILYLNDILAHSIQLLVKHYLVHADLNDGNILIDTTDRPIIIDFGLSINLKKPFNKDTAKQAFFFYPFTTEGALDSYEPWAVEIAINSYLLAKIGWDNSITEQHIPDIKSISDRYIDGIKFLTTHKNTVTQSDVATYKTKKHHVIDKFLNKSVKEVIQDLTNASFQYWDTYAIGIMTSKYLNFYCPNAITPDIANKLKSQILF
jgi:thiamine kinase-like enzyme